MINLPSEDLVKYIDRLALTTGKNPVPEKRRLWGYCYEPDKFGIAGFTSVRSESVAPPRVRRDRFRRSQVKRWQKIGDVA